MAINNEALRRRGNIEWIHVRHEEVGGLRGGRRGEITGRLAVCAGCCGPGQCASDQRSLRLPSRPRVPVLAIAAHIPSPEIGSGYFQETHPQNLFRECSHYCELVSRPAPAPYVLEIAMRTAIGQRGVAVIIIPATSPVKAAPERAARRIAGCCRHRPVVVPRSRSSRRSPDCSTAPSGSPCSAAPVAPARTRRCCALAEALKSADRARARAARRIVEYDNPYDVGMTGLIGFSSG